MIVPGGFSYGDYLRAGAIARFSPVMESVDRASPATAGSCSASATASRCCARRGLLPGRAAAEHRRCASPAARSTLEVVNADTALTRACAAGERLSIPAKHTTGRYYAPEPMLDELEANGQVVLRYATGQNFNGSPRDIAGVRTPRATSSG